MVLPQERERLAVERGFLGENGVDVSGPDSAFRTGGPNRRITDCTDPLAGACPPVALPPVSPGWSSPKNP
jgi:hypothetical protein